jgi:hypothetical protein
LESTFTFLNLSNTTSRVDVRAFDNSGNPVDLLSLASTFASEQAVHATGVELAAFGVGSLESFSASPAVLAVGWLEVTTEGFSATDAETVFSVVGNGGGLVTSTNVATSQPMTEFSFVAFATPTSRTGIALLNPPTNVAAQVTLTLLDRLGQQVDEISRTVTPGHKVVLFVDELFAGLQDFVGSVEVRSSVGVVPMSVRVDQNTQYTTQVIHPARSIP